MTPLWESDILTESLSVIISCWPFIRWGVWVHPSFHVYTLQGDCGVCSTPLHMELIPPPRFQIEVTPLVHVEAAPQLMVHTACYRLLYVWARGKFPVILWYLMYYIICYVTHDSHVLHDTLYLLVQYIFYSVTMTVMTPSSVYFLFSYHVSYDPQFSIFSIQLPCQLWPPVQYVFWFSYHVSLTLSHYVSYSDTMSVWLLVHYVFLFSYHCHCVLSSYYGFHNQIPMSYLLFVFPCHIWFQFTMPPMTVHRFQAILPSYVTKPDMTLCHFLTRTNTS